VFGFLWLLPRFRGLVLALWMWAASDLLLNDGEADVAARQELDQR
jgi:hypothetical protein